MAKEKAIIISIRPKYVDLIKKGQKTKELRKQIPKDFEGWVYIYETLNGGGSGKVIGKFWYDEFTKLKPLGFNYYDEEGNIEYEQLQEELCLDYLEIGNYGNEKDLYAWHIKDLEMFKEPKELMEMNWNNSRGYPALRPPQNWAYVFEREEQDIYDQLNSIMELDKTSNPETTEKKLTLYRFLIFALILLITIMAVAWNWK